MNDDTGNDTIGQDPVAGNRWANWKDRAVEKAAWLESRFLSLLRYASLTIAALVLLGAAMFLGLGLVRQIGSTNVSPQSVALDVADVTPEKVEAKAKAEPAAPAKPVLGDAARKRTLAIYLARFKPFQRADTKINEKDIVDFVWTADRLNAYAGLAGRLKDAEGNALPDANAVVLHALGLIETAAQTDELHKRLVAFRDAKKVNVCNDEVRTRSRTIASWDSTATFCPSWYETPVGCATTSTVDEPYVTKVCEMKFPADLESPAELLAGSVERYAVTAAARLDAADNDAQAKAVQIMARKAEGIGNMGTSAQLLLGFLAIMFLYLFVAMERHHRTLRRLIDKTED